MSRCGVKHVVGFSGGIDSQACARFVLNRFPKGDVILLNSNAGGNEHPITEEFVSDYSANIHPVISVRPVVRDINRPISGELLLSLDINLDSPLTFPMLAKLKGYFPTGRMQFCTEALKLNPMKRWQDENMRGYEVIRYTGVRRDESRNRSDTPLEEWDKFFDCERKNPLAKWKKQHCFDFVRGLKETTNPLYSLGFDRVGCSPCVNSTKSDIKAWALRFPEMIAKVRSWEEFAHRPFFAYIVPGKTINWIDEVVEWALTDRGGKQFNIFNTLAPPSCESRFGLCD